ncbi:MAG TPA: carboxypeptidase-like regulatory domain-containing protein [Vicinamibacterales bacterium]|jgi:hypothetical protein|nr:carboxypeptidase-like regulatory domain-containing protein [Vicinamibacterales bacterium]
MPRCGCHLLALLSVVAMVTPAAAQLLQPPGTPPQSYGSAQLTGRVVAADNGRPVRRAHLRLSERPYSERNADPDHVYVSRDLDTDGDGRFAFLDLPAGSYVIYVDAVNGFARLEWPKEATVTEGRTVETTIRMERTGAIEGRLQDYNGDGLPGMRLYAVSKRSVSGHAGLGPAASTTTNDLGEFRLPNLPAGEYYVLATPYDNRPAAIDGRQEPAPQTGSANTYYPGVPALQGARVVEVRAGRDSERVNFTMARRHLAKLSINPVDSRGVPLGRDAQATLTRRDDVYLSESGRHTSRREDGALLFDGIQPGDYELGVITSYRMEEAAYVKVSINEADVSLRVQTNTGAKVSGRVIVDGEPGDRTSRYASVFSMKPFGKYGFSYAREQAVHVERTDRFELTGLRGPMVVSADVGGGALVSIQRHGEEMAGKTVEFVGTETLDDVVVELTTRVAQLDVTVTSASARKEPESVLLFLFPEDPLRWHQGFVRYSRALPTSARPGEISPVSARLIRLPAGRYLVAAVPDADGSYPTDVGVLERLRPLATPVTLVAGQTAKVTIVVAKTRKN